MTVIHMVEVKVVKKWEDRGGTEWVTVSIENRDGFQRLDLHPEQVISLEEILMERGYKLLRPKPYAGD